MEAVSLQKVSRTFKKANGEEFSAVADVSLDIHEGEIFCIVGPDGAGKTTAVRMMCGVLAPSSGDILIKGLDVRKERDEAKKHIGYLSQRFSLYADLTIDENIDFFAEIHGKRSFESRKRELLDMTRLGPFAGRLAGNLSGGMKQKLALACTLIHEPDVIFLDEPTTGVDPVSRRDFWRILSALLKDGMTIIVTTPYLDEAERSSRVALMDHGRIVKCDTPESIRAHVSFDVYEVSADDVHSLADQLTASLSTGAVHVFGDRLHVLIPRGRESTNIPEELARIGSDRVKKISPSLEDVFIQQTQEFEV
jgi:ABC-2 type transport system ATP-binding protein